ncbi:MAG: hypothetical protein C3F12_12055 [Candidatus Methylomirabilota bacterium]|nr:MAG: hypothetical protein C3F12_12055 [candidate division NC10 bacterium]
MDVRWAAERHAGAEGPIGNAGRPDRVELESSRSRFPHLLTEAGARMDETANGRDVATATDARTIRIVRPGDTLSHMVQAALRESGASADVEILYRTVGIVARANRLTDPDRIRPGQAIDFSAVLSGTRGSRRDIGLHRHAAVAEASIPPAGILHGLRALMQSFAGRLSSSFGPRIDPVTGVRAFHAGVDIRMPAGSLVYPAAPGRVIFSGRTVGYGNLIVLAHTGGFTTSYGHNASNLIPVGVVVDREMPIAVVGATGRATGPHLHFELRKNGYPIDPMVGSPESEDRREQQDL